MDPRKLATVAFLGFGLVLWMRAQFNTQVTPGVILLPIVLQGAAMAFFFVPLQAIIFSGLKPEQMPAASGLSNFVRITAGAIGTSLFTTLWDNRASLHHAHLVEAISAGSHDATTQAMLAQLAAAGQSAEQANATLNRLIDQQAYTMAVTDVFHLSALLFIALIVLLWLAAPRSVGAGAAADAGGAH
jgi:DHA2 family multidrug resistance protein